MTVQRRTRATGFFDVPAAAARRAGGGQHGGRPAALREPALQPRQPPRPRAPERLAAGRSREAVLSIFTGGAHCCFETLIALVDGPSRGRRARQNWGDPGYSGQCTTASYQFVTADDRFAYGFTAFAASGLPVQVLDDRPVRALRRHHADAARPRPRRREAVVARLRAGAREARRRHPRRARRLVRRRVPARRQGRCTTELGEALAKDWLTARRPLAAEQGLRRGARRGRSRSGATS